MAGQPAHPRPGRGWSSRRPRRETGARHRLVRVVGSVATAQHHRRRGHRPGRGWACRRRRGQRGRRRRQPNGTRWRGGCVARRLHRCAARCRHVAWPRCRHVRDRDHVGPVAGLRRHRPFANDGRATQRVRRASLAVVPIHARVSRRARSVLHVVGRRPPRFGDLDVVRDQGGLEHCRGRRRWHCDAPSRRRTHAPSRRLRPTAARALRRRVTCRQEHPRSATPSSTRVCSSTRDECRTSTIPTNSHSQLRWQPAIRGSPRPMSSTQIHRVRSCSSPPS